MLKFLRIDRPTSATLRPSASAASTTCCTRWTFEAKQVTMILPVGARERLQERRPDARFRGRDAGPVGVGRVAAEAEQALRAELGEAGEVGRDAVDRRLVELVIAGQQDRAEVGVDCDRAGVGDRVRHVDHLDPEAAGLLDRARLEVPQRHVAELVLLELRADHADRQPAAVDGRRDADLAEDVGQRADVVLVAVGEDDRLDVVELVRADRRSPAGRDRSRASRRSGTSAPCRRSRSCRRTRSRSCSCRSRRARRAAGSAACRDSRDHRRGRAVRGRRGRRPRWASSSGTIGSRIRSEQIPSICSAPLIGIGLVVTVSASYSGSRVASSSLRRSRSPALKRS